MSVLFSLIMVTGGRVEEVAACIGSLRGQMPGRVELIVVDQNQDDRLAEIIAAGREVLPIMWLRSPVRRINHSRNLGLRAAGGAIIGYPDDDCLFPPGLLAAVARRFESDAALDLLTGVAVAPDGRRGSGRWRRRGGAITAANVWTSAIEFALFGRRVLLQQLGGFDEAMGLGTEFASGDAQDLILRALRLGAVARYDPSLRMIHPDKRLTRVAAERAFAYGAGLGYVLRKHRLVNRSALPFFIRPAGGMLSSLIRLRRCPMQYYARTLRGRVYGVMAGPSG